MACRLEQHLPRAKSKAENFGLFSLYPCYFFICCLAFPWPTSGCYGGKRLTHPMLITAFGLSVFDPELTRRGWSCSTPNCSVGFDRNAITPQIAENTLWKLKSIFSKEWKCPQYPKQLYLEIVVAYRLA